MGSGWCGSTRWTPRPAWRQVVAETLHVAGGERSLLERLAGAETVLLLDNCEHVVEPVARAGARRCSTRSRGCGSSPPARSRWVSTDERVHTLAPLCRRGLGALFARRAREMRRQGSCSTPTRRRWSRRCAAALDGLPLAIELAARGFGRCRCATSPVVSTTGSPCSGTRRSQRPERRRALAGRDRLELRAAVPRRPARAVGPVLLRRRRLAGRRRARARGARRTVRRRRSTRSADWWTGPWSASTSPTTVSVRYRLLDSIRAFAADRLRRGRRRPMRPSPPTPGGTPTTAAWCEDHVRSDRQPECVAIARAERANVDAALAWCAAQRPRTLGVEHRQRVRVDLGRAR